MPPVSNILEATKEFGSQYFIWILAVSAFALIVSPMIAWLLILRLPEDYLCRPVATSCRETPQSPLPYFVQKIGFNSLGFILLMTGIIMLVTPC